MEILCSDAGLVARCWKAPFGNGPCSLRLLIEFAVNLTSVFAACSDADFVARCWKAPFGNGPCSLRLLIEFAANLTSVFAACSDADFGGRFLKVPFGTKVLRCSFGLHVSQRPLR